MSTCMASCRQWQSDIAKMPPNTQAAPLVLSTTGMQQQLSGAVELALATLQGLLGDTVAQRCDAELQQRRQTLK